MRGLGFSPGTSVAVLILSKSDFFSGGRGSLKRPKLRSIRRKKSGVFFFSPFSSLYRLFRRLYDGPPLTHPTGVGGVATFLYFFFSFFLELALQKRDEHATCDRLVSSDTFARKS